MRRHSLLGGTCRCRGCQNRVPSGLSICPYCGLRLRRSWRGPLLVMVLLCGGILTTHVLTTCLPWSELRLLPERLRLPKINFLTTPTFAPVQTATRTATATARPSSTATATATEVSDSATQAAPEMTSPPSGTPEAESALADRGLQPRKAAVVCTGDAQM